MGLHSLESARRRRFGVALALSLTLHALLALLPFSPLRTGATGPDQGSGGQEGLLQQFLAAAMLGAEVSLAPAVTATAAPQADASTPTEPALEAPTATEESQPTAENAATADRAEPGDPGEAGAAAAGLGQPADGEGRDGAPEPPPEMALIPRLQVHPKVPFEIVRKRKIDDFVLLQVLVGTDGSVRDVRVLRTIPDCAECTASIVEAAWRFRYDPVLVGGRLAEVWTVPFDYRFNYKR